MNTTLEFCVTELRGAEIAAEYGANRIELCVDLSCGGVTPSAGLIEACSVLIETHVLIRPRSGNFVYSEDELSIIRADILQAHLAGATGIVFGCLDEKNELDKAGNESILALAEQLSLHTTFHRAIDFVNDPIKAMEVLEDWEVGRVLTSGQGETALEGVETLKAMVGKMANQPLIMAGGGVNPINGKALLDAGVHALHCSIHKKAIDSGSMGSKVEYDFDKVKGILALIA